MKKMSSNKSIGWYVSCARPHVTTIMFIYGNLNTRRSYAILLSSRIFYTLRFCRFQFTNNKHSHAAAGTTWVRLLRGIPNNNYWSTSVCVYITRNTLRAQCLLHYCCTLWRARENRLQCSLNDNLHRVCRKNITV